MKKAEALLNQQSMPKSIVELNTAEDFNNLLKNFPDKIIIIDFWAVWCGPCIFFAPIYKRLQEEFQEEFIFAKVNVDENRTPAMKYGITGIPTTLFIKNGEVLNKVVGAMNYDGMKQLLDKLND
ncbi:MAG: thioredoxin [Promethearchaeota archaeon]